MGRQGTQNTGALRSSLSERHIGRMKLNLLSDGKDEGTGGETDVI